MKRAGRDRDVFTHDTVAMLHEAASGGMRDLDHLATGYLRETARKKRKLVERDLLPRVFDRDGLGRTGDPDFTTRAPPRRRACLPRGGAPVLSRRCALPAHHRDEQQPASSHLHQRACAATLTGRQRTPICPNVLRPSGSVC